MPFGYRFGYRFGFIKSVIAFVWKNEAEEAWVNESAEEWTNS